MAGALNLLSPHSRHRKASRPLMPSTPVTQADAELERLLAKSPDSALHLFGDSSHGRLRLGVRPQLALIFLGPGPPFHLAPGSFYSLFLPFGHLRRASKILAIEFGEDAGPLRPVA